jgi:hypothetical protein
MAPPWEEGMLKEPDDFDEVDQELHDEFEDQIDMIHEEKALKDKSMFIEGSYDDGQHRIILEEHCTLSKYLVELYKEEFIPLGSVTNCAYMIPMYFLPYVPGETITRMAVLDTGTTRLIKPVMISSVWRHEKLKKKKLSGLSLLIGSLVDSNALETEMKSLTLKTLWDQMI